ncbi:MAG: hypothetical protein IKE11_03015 [Clostridia bacterium]|nr:hypothetical protein [Clostridia bacterium]
MINKRRIVNACPDSFLSVYRFLKKTKNYLCAVYWGSVLNRKPEKHAKHEVKREKQVLVRPFNISQPKYFGEKLLWLKYYVYNNSGLIAQCYNKYEVREYIKSKGLAHILNDLYGVWDDVEEINWEKLPDEYVMKVSNGYAGHVFKRKEEVFDVEKAKKTLKETKRKYSYYYKITGDLFVAKTKQHIICERLLESSLGYLSPEDYKFYCFNGEPLFVEFMANRSGSKDYNYKEVFVDINLQDRHELEGEAHEGSFEAPSCYGEMIQIARILSQDFPFVRVDLYAEKGKVIFGELTFTPTHVQTIESQIQLGELLDLNDVDKKYPRLIQERRIV